jgi:hypothetical protein
VNVTVPVGVPEPGAAMTAVKITDWPGTAGLADDESVVVVIAAVTTSVC